MTDNQELYPFDSPVRNDVKLLSWYKPDKPVNSFPVPKHKAS